jgi:hypothetical protein
MAWSMLARATVAAGAATSACAGAAASVMKTLSAAPQAPARRTEIPAIAVPLLRPAEIRLVVDLRSFPAPMMPLSATARNDVDQGFLMPG